jgi:hypothetical protein
VRLEGVHGFARTLGAALGEVQDLLRARDATLATHAAGLDAVTRAEFLFATAADAWVARRRAEKRWDVLALGARGLRLRDPELVPTAALERLSRRWRRTAWPGSPSAAAANGRAG